MTYLCSGAAGGHPPDQSQVRPVRDDPAGGGVPEGHGRLRPVREPRQVIHSVLHLNFHKHKHNTHCYV